VTRQDSSDEFDPTDGRRITCREFVERVTSYLELDLAEADRRNFEAHAHYCSGCGTYLRQMLMTIEGIRGTLLDDVLGAGEVEGEDVAASSDTQESDADPASLDELLRAFREDRDSG
jgi:hypothetical protein